MAGSVVAGLRRGTTPRAASGTITHGSFALCRSARPGPALGRAAAGGRVARASTRPGRLLAGGRRAHCAERRRLAPRVRPAGERLPARACRAHPRLRPRGAERRVYTVANVNRGLARRIDELPALWVEGEIGDLRYNPKFGFTFLTLRDPDEGATLSVTMARWAFERIDPRPVEGQRVQVHGKVTLYDKRAELSLRADRIEPAGDGALLARIEEARRRLDADGLFDAGAQAPAAALAARHRPDRGARGGRAARRDPQRPRPPRLGALRAGRDGGAGRARRARDPARAGGARRARRRRRDRDRARRRLAGGPAAVLGRGAVPRDRGLLHRRRLGRGARARRPAVRSRGRPPRVDARPTPRA